LFTKGKCLNLFQDSCGADVCCLLIFHATLDTAGRTLPQNVTDSGSVQNYADCPPPPATCSPHCKQIIYAPSPDTTNDVVCDIPCNTGFWQNASSGYIPMYYCQPCSIKIYYRWRITDCIPPYIDFRLDSIDHRLCPCDTDPLLDPYITFANSWMLTYGGPIKPVPGECDTNYRIVNSPCWRIIPVGDTSFMTVRCLDSNCCISHWSLCITPFPYDTILTCDTVYTTYYYTTCNDTACTALCTVPPSKFNETKGELSLSEISSGKKIITTFIYPNPGEEKINFNLLSYLSGKVKLKIFNLEGEQILQYESELNRNVTNIPIDVSKLARGVYHYEVILNKLSVDQGKFVVSK